MTDQPSLKQFLDEMSNYADQDAAQSAAASKAGVPPIGRVLEIAGSGSRVVMDSSKLIELQSHGDPSMAMSGQVGSQLKVRVGPSWLVANVRTLRAGDEENTVIANVDFLGEGSQRGDGGLTSFRRGVTRYPIPGAAVLPVTTEDMRAIFAADDSPHVEIGTVYPTDDIRGTLYVDPMLSKHFAILGSTGTGNFEDLADWRNAGLRRRAPLSGVEVRIAAHLVEELLQARLIVHGRTPPS